MQSIAPAAGAERTHASTHAHAAAPSMVNAFDYVNEKPVPISASQLASTKDAVLRTAVTNASRVMTFLHDTFGRNGIDNHGQKLDVVVHVTEPEDWGLDTHAARTAVHGLRRGATATIPMNNAFWDSESKKMYLGDGDGETFSPLGGSVDIIAHEAGHAVLDSEVRMSFDPTESPTAPQQGALHESFGDVLGALVEGDWQIGEDTLTPATPGDAIRDMSKPEQFSDMSQIGDETEPHLLADIPNLAAYRAAQAIGQSDMGQVWYHGFLDHMVDHASFADAAAATVAAARSIYGAASTQATAVTEAWTSVGVTPSTKLRHGA